jgi:heme exporter protein B
MRAAFWALIIRDLKLAIRSGGGAGLSLFFFLLIVVLVPLAVGPDLNTLARLSPAILWLGAVLSTLISLDRLFQADEEDGSLDAMRLSALPLEGVVFAKMISHWMTTGLPLTLAAPMLGLLVALPWESISYVMLSLVVGTPALTAMGAVGAALTVSLRRGGLLLSILVIPLMIPTLIFGVSAASSATSTVAFLTPFLVLCALTLIALFIGVVACAAALRGSE